MGNVVLKKLVTAPNITCHYKLKHHSFIYYRIYGAVLPSWIPFYLILVVPDSILYFNISPPSSLLIKQKPSRKHDITNFYMKPYTVNTLGIFIYPKIK